VNKCDVHDGKTLFTLKSFLSKRQIMWKHYTQS